ncbi:hypothetical protein [Nocardia crassostreae]|uniref:hypothetical protein n=1 Tax=Nocardia crassostreae TaxID=53428 RepID=UPI00082EE073|nr:hypothetical protein [Nocardia crassostreae]
MNAAEEQLATPRTRLAAELITHRPEPEGVDFAELTELQEIRRALARENPQLETPHATPGDEILIDYGVLPNLLPAPAAPPHEETTA